MAYRDTGHEDHSHGHVSYIIVFFALMVFTAISIVADVIHIPNEAIKIVIVMAVAVAKATCVLLFFMHLKFEGNWKYILLAPTTILAIGLPIALMPDVATSYYISDVPQRHDYEEYLEHHAHHDAAHADQEHGEADDHDRHAEQNHGDEHDQEDPSVVGKHSPANDEQAGSEDDESSEE